MENTKRKDELDTLNKTKYKNMGNKNFSATDLNIIVNRGYM
jgi:hypothetical protein